MFKCEKCPYESAKKYIVKTHAREVHDNIRDHICKVCGSAFSRSWSLKEHVNNMHLKEKIVQCEKCPYHFINLPEEKMSKCTLEQFMKKPRIMYARNVVRPLPSNNN